VRQTASILPVIGCLGQGHSGSGQLLAQVVVDEGRRRLLQHLCGQGEGVSSRCMSCAARALTGRNNASLTMHPEQSGLSGQEPRCSAVLKCVQSMRGDARDCSALLPTF
jgi:hypothetical protein